MDLDAATITDWEESADEPLLGRESVTPPAAPSSTPSPAEAATADPSTPTEAVSDVPDESRPLERNDKGQFRRARHRAASQRASVEDVPRIKELTGKLRSEEEAHTATRNEIAALRAQIDELRARSSQPPASERRAETPRPAERPPMSAAPEDPEPDPADATKYPDGVYDRKFLADYSRWAARMEHRTLREAEAKTAAATAARDGWRGRVDAARGEFADYDAVAFNESVNIPVDSTVDTWIMQHPQGAKVLYHLRKNPAELSTLLGKSVIEQISDLALLSQRLSTPSRTAAGTTGAAPAPALRSVPRPPTPVRTSGPVSSPGNGSPDPDDDNLDAHMKFYYPKGRKRGA